MFDISDLVQEFGFTKISALIIKMWLVNRLDSKQAGRAWSELQEYYNFVYPDKPKPLPMSTLAKRFI